MMSLKMNLIVANSEDPVEMQDYLHFIRVFTVCQSTHLGVSRTYIQRIKCLPVLLIFNLIKFSGN